MSARNYLRPLGLAFVQCFFVTCMHYTYSHVVVDLAIWPPAQHPWSSDYALLALTFSWVRGLLQGCCSLVIEGPDRPSLGMHGGCMSVQSVQSIHADPHW